MKRNDDEQREFDTMLEEFKCRGGEVQVVTMDDVDVEVEKQFARWYTQIGMTFARMRRN